MEHEIRVKSTGELMGWLTTDSPMSHYGIPVLRFSEPFDDPERSCDYGPADMITHTRDAGMFGPYPAAELVANWVKGQVDTLPEPAVAAARRFLAQWPDGPQI